MTSQSGQPLTFDYVFGEVSRLLDKFRAGDAQISAETVIAEDLAMDSLQIMDLMMELEDKFDVSIPLNMVPDIATVGQLAQTILASRKAA